MPLELRCQNFLVKDLINSFYNKLIHSSNYNFHYFQSNTLPPILPPKITKPAAIAGSNETLADRTVVQLVFQTLLELTALNNKSVFFNS